MSDNNKVINEIKEALRSVMRERLAGEKPRGKKVLYASMEKLPGATSANTLMNLDPNHPIRDMLKKAGISYDDLAKADKDPALGNGGLGRLAACIQEACASGNIPFTLSTLCYREGLFCQKLGKNGQVAVPDNWRDEDGSYFFEFPDPSKAKFVSFKNNGQYVWVEMIPCSIPQIGANGGCSDSWVWKVGRVLAPEGMDTGIYHRIDEKLYPKDANVRLMQEYAVSSVTVRNAVEECIHQGRPLEDLPKLFCLHINDTHATLMIPELIRILLDEHFSPRKDAWDKAWEIASQIFVYTNHTILPEALETWELSRMREILPTRVTDILCEIDRRVKERLEASRIPLTREEKEDMYIIYEDPHSRTQRVRMANLCIHTSRSVNGVAKLHTQILCQRLFKSFCKVMPGKFRNVTNAIGMRKFLGYANPELTNLIGRCISSPDFVNHPEDLVQLLSHVKDPKLQDDFLTVKGNCKQLLADFIRDQRHIDIPKNFLFHVQVKRLHMYKRQLLNCLYILWLYCRIKEDKHFHMVPTAFIFGGKAADDYAQAKDVIRLVMALEDLINVDPEVNDRLRVAMVEDFNVTKGMRVYSAADISVQISTAGKEASGTGNMKFMVNGGLTLGTLDGANVEIYEAVGDEGMFVFGLRENEIEAMKYTYCARDLYKADPQLRQVLDMLRDGICGRSFPALYNELLNGADGKRADEFFVLADFRAYIDANRRIWDLYQKPKKFAEQCLRNIALSGRFSSDRMVTEYRDTVWNPNT